MVKLVAALIGKARVQALDMLFPMQAYQIMLLDIYAEHNESFDKIATTVHNLDPTEGHNGKAGTKFRRK